MEPLPHRDVASVHCATKTPVETNLRTTRDDKDKKTKNNVTAAHATTGDEQSNEAQQLVHYRRDGAMSVTGQLYETKLLTLFLLRLLSNKVEFYLGANISGVGALDDVCFKYKPANSEQYVVVFLQAKHKVNPDKNKLKMSDVLSNDGDFSVQKHFDSYLMIRQRFTPKSKDVIFKGTYHDSQCYFVIYTPLKHDLKMGRKPLEKNETNHNVKELLKSNSGDIFQLEYKNFEFLKEQLVEKNIRQLAKTFFAYIMKGNANNNVMEDTLINLYQMVLAQSVIEMIETTAEGVRYKFRSQFFDNKDRLTTIFRETLYDEAVENKTFNTTDGDTSSLVSQLVKDVSAESISNIIGNVVTYDQETNKLVLIDDNVNDDKNLNTFKYIKDFIVEPSIIRNAINIKGKKILEGQEFTIPNEFGDRDLTFKCKTDKIDRRLEFLAESLVKLFKIAKYSDGIHFMDVYESMVGPGRLVARGVMEYNGGLGSALGNLLVVDGNTGALKFNVCSPLPEHALSLWNKLKQKHDEHLLVSYRFKICVDCFPKTSFQDNIYEEYLVKDFISQYWLCTGQSKEDEVECIAKKHINVHLKSVKGKRSLLRAKTEAVFLNLHDKMQKWWMLDTAQYLTEKSTYLQDTISEVSNDQLLSVLNYICVHKLKSVDLQFSEDAVKSVGINEASNDHVLIVTDSITHTAVKLMQHFNHKSNYTFIDLSYIPSALYDDLALEVTNSNVGVLIVLCKVMADMEAVCEALAELLQDVPNSQVIVIADALIAVALEQELKCCYRKVRDNKNRLIDLNSISKKKILNECKFVHQDEIVVLASIGQDSHYLITSHILEKLVKKEMFQIGKALATTSYINMEKFYIERYLIRREKSLVIQNDDCSSGDTTHSNDGKFGERYMVKNLKDLTQNIVVVTAPAGMGKSTLLTHLSLATKKMYPNVWIARINLLDHTKLFREWHQSNTTIGKVESLSVLSNAVINATCEFVFVETDNGVVLVTDNMNAMEMLQAELFLKAYNNEEVIFVFDGFDEICPLYEREVIQLIKITTASESKGSRAVTLKEPKLWIASRSYNNVKHVIEREFGLSYSLEPLTEEDQNIFLKKYWSQHMKLEEFTHEQFFNVITFIRYMNESWFPYAYYESNDMVRTGPIVATPVERTMHVELHSVYFYAYEYFLSAVDNMTLISAIQTLKECGFNKDSAIFFRFQQSAQNSTHVNFNSGSPLLTLIAAEYLQTEIQHNLSNRDMSSWDLDTNTFSLYKRVLETKLTKIRFEEKNAIDVSKPDSKLIYDNVHAEFIDVHRMLGLYALFRDEAEQIMTVDEMSRVKRMIDEIKFASEKTGVIDCIVDDVPVFVHRTFAEYFAADYICEALKSAYASQQLDRLETIWDFIMMIVYMRESLCVSCFLEYKLFKDDELSYIVNEEQSQRMVANCILKQSRVGNLTAADCTVSRTSSLIASLQYFHNCLAVWAIRDPKGFSSGWCSSA